MNGNKPAANLVSAFTKRVAGHPRVAYLPDPRCAPKSGALITMVIDELLVDPAALTVPDVSNHLHSVAEQTHQSVFPKKKKGPNPEIWRLTKTPGNKGIPDVAYHVWQCRKFLPKGDAGQVAPNHVLIPPSNFHTCPWGPPEEPAHAGVDLGAAGSGVRVTVIDSGYVTGSPIDTRLANRATFGWWFTAHPKPGVEWGWVQETEKVSGAPSSLDQDDNQVLDALAGHANFVAGVVAQACPTAIIDVVSHNGSFVKSDIGDPIDTPLPTEASVARSLWETLQQPASPGGHVITVGFAFPTLPYAQPVGAPRDGPPSWTFKAVLESIDKKTDVTIVAPAGNQGCTVPQYPAAFWLTYPHRVIGVGSIHPSSHHRSDFSNYGRWVACCTEGEDVFSTFVTWCGPTEEAEPQGTVPSNPSKDFNGWATWEGTCFAVPKVAGALAEQRNAAGGTLAAAWATITGPPRKSPPDLEMGVRLDGLPPV